MAQVSVFPFSRGPAIISTGIQGGLRFSIFLQRGKEIETFSSGPFTSGQSCSLVEDASGLFRAHFYAFVPANSPGL